MLDDGKSQPGAADFARTGAVHPVEALKEAVKMLGGNADARIRNAVPPPFDADAGGRRSPIPPAYCI